MFYLGYLRAELLRRRGRTILTLLGLALGVALVIAIASLSKGLDEAQSATLDPLAGIGTDLTVTRAAEEGAGAGPFGGGGSRDVVEANQAVITDLSKLGKPGTHFVHDFFLPGTQLTFPQAQVDEIASLDGVAAVSAGLTLQAVHQEGKVPTIVAKIQTGGDRIDVERAIAPPTAAEQEEIRECLADLGVTLPDARRGAPRPSQGGPLPARARAAASAATAPRTRTRSPSASPSACSASAPRSQRRARRSSRSSTRRRPTSRAGRTRSAASSSVTRPWGS